MRFYMRVILKSTVLESNARLDPTHKHYINCKSNVYVC